MKNVSALVSLSEEAYASRDFQRALTLLDEIIELAPESAEGVGSRHLRAMAYEYGNAPGGKDLEKTFLDYRFLADRAEMVGSVGLVGCARILYERDPEAHLEETKRLCLEAVDLDGDVRAKMLLGYLCTVTSDFIDARQWFLSAFKGGSPWGLKYYAATFTQERKIIRAAAWSLPAALFWRVLSMRNKASSPYH